MASLDTAIGHGLGHLSQLKQGRAEIAVGFCEIRPDFQEFSVLKHGILDQSLLEQAAAARRGRLAAR